MLELNKVKKLQTISRLSSVTMYSNCCTTEYSLSLMSKVRKIKPFSELSCRDSNYRMQRPTYYGLLPVGELIRRLPRLIRTRGQIFSGFKSLSLVQESLGQRWRSRRERLTFFTVEILLSFSRQLESRLVFCSVRANRISCYEEPL